MCITGTKGDTPAALTFPLMVTICRRLIRTPLKLKILERHNGLFFKGGPPPNQIVPLLGAQVAAH
jgi:hypothetical protein